MLEELLSQLKLQLGIDFEAIPNQKGQFSLLIDPQTKVFVKDLEPGAYFSTPLAPFLEEGRESIVMHLMKANYIGQGTGDGALALDTEEKNLLFTLSCPKHLTYQTFCEALESFLNFTAYWRTEVTSPKFKIL